MSDTAKSPLDFLDTHETRTLARLAGIFVNGAVETIEINREKITFGYIQLLVKDRPDSPKLRLEQIKVREPDFGTIDIMNKSKMFQGVNLQIEITENRGKVAKHFYRDQKAGA